MRTWLVDTGPLVAYLDAADPAYDTVAEALDLHEILTLDRRGFGVYRTRKDEPLVNVLDLEPG